jgi:hypothetical protein
MLREDVNEGKRRESFRDKLLIEQPGMGIEAIINTIDYPRACEAESIPVIAIQEKTESGHLVNMSDVAPPPKRLYLIIYNFSVF